MNLSGDDLRAVRSHRRPAVFKQHKSDPQITRESLQADVQRFLDQGGQIQQIPTGVGSDAVYLTVTEEHRRAGLRGAEAAKRLLKGRKLGPRK